MLLIIEWLLLIYLSYGVNYGASQKVGSATLTLFQLNSIGMNYSKRINVCPTVIRSPVISSERSDNDN